MGVRSETKSLTSTKETNRIRTSNPKVRKETQLITKSFDLLLLTGIILTWNGDYFLHI